MAYTGKKAELRVDLSQVFQAIDGFGVNINAQYWIGDKLKPAVDLLVHELGATIFRVDIWGKSNWIDPTGSLGQQALEPARLAEIYQGEIFQRGWAMLRYLNELGVEPYLTASGDVPRWMLADDGRTLQNYAAFADMLVSFVEWAREKEGIHFKWFGPLNETDLGSPEGPTVSPLEYVRVLEVLHEKLNLRGITDLQFVVPEQGSFNTNYIRELVKSEKLRQRIGAFSMHDYADLPPQMIQSVVDAVENSPYAGKRLWFGEFGDLEQSGEIEWPVAWWMTSRLLDHLAGGFQASLVWDAFDNYHDHDAWWTIYGILRTGLRVFTPKKRYYALRQVYRFVQPGFQRVSIHCDTPDVRVLAFTNPAQNELTIVGMNLSPVQTYFLNINVPSHLADRKARYMRTRAEENCIDLGQVAMRGANWPFTGLAVQVPPESIFTLTTL
jgi:O-glycosyl hydrolase